MSLAGGTRIGPYEVISLLGAGGMGEVYRSRDTKLKREVAIKVLPADLLRDPERTRRLRREAEILATLNHPHIAQIYGLEESGGMLCLVLELVDGETLAERLRRGPLPPREALAIAAQIAEALAAAHEREVVHRDLKPANVKVTPGERVKVLDFGLAKALGPEGAEADLSQSPTRTAQTMPGVLLGTAAYMSPEQAKGRPVDARADVWAFGAVLYEMLAGKPAFAGEDVVQILSEILKTDPDWSALPEGTPAIVRSLLKRCLQKERGRRLAAIADARFLIEEALNEPAAGLAHAGGRVLFSRERLGWGTAVAVLLAALSALAVQHFRRGPEDGRVLRLEVSTPPAEDPSAFAISPDGRRIVFQATTESGDQLWIRPLDAEEARPVAGTEDGTNPFWSPDSRAVGFFAGGFLKKVDLDSGIVQNLANASGPWGAWGKDGTILFDRNWTSLLHRVPAEGGQAAQATRLKTPHGHPQFLPDGRRFLFRGEMNSWYLGSLDSTDARRLFESDWGRGQFVPPDRFFFERQGALLAQRLDPRTLAPVGSPFPVARQVAVNQDTVPAFSVSATGAIAYRAGGPERQLAWVDRSSGRQTEALGSPDAGQPTAMRLSPDGRSVSFMRRLGGESNIWLMDTERGVLSPLTADKDHDWFTVWSPDGSRIAFSSGTGGNSGWDLYEIPAAGSAAKRILWESPDDEMPEDWSADGRFILYRTLTAGSGSDLWALPLSGERKPAAVAHGPSVQASGRFSPDGRRVAYQSNESERHEIYVQPFPGPGGRAQITTGGGTSPQWRGDGRELFYIGPDNWLMAAPMTVDGSRGGAPVKLIQLPPQSEYAASRDGRRFLVNRIVKDASPITILLNWRPPEP